MIQSPTFAALLRQMEADLETHKGDLPPLARLLIEKYRDTLFVLLESSVTAPVAQPMTPLSDERQRKWQETQERLQREKLGELQLQAQREEHGPRMLPCEGGDLDGVMIEVGVDAPDGAYLPIPDHGVVYQLRGNKLVYSEQQTQRYREHLQARLT